MLRITVENAPAERWVPVVQRCFEMTLAPIESAIALLRVQLSAPAQPARGDPYTCELHGRTVSGRTLHLRSAHENGEQAVAHVFGRARRELRRGHLRTPLVSGRTATTHEAYE